MLWQVGVDLTVKVKVATMQTSVDYLQGMADGGLVLTTVPSAGSVRITCLTPGEWVFWSSPDGSVLFGGLYDGEAWDDSLLPLHVGAEDDLWVVDPAGSSSFVADLWWSYEAEDCQTKSGSPQVPAVFVYFPSEIYDLHVTRRLGKATFIEIVLSPRLAGDEWEESDDWSFADEWVESCWVDTDEWQELSGAQ